MYGKKELGVPSAPISLGPVSRDDDVSDYIPTQVLSEFLKTEKYAGIAFSGSLDPDGVNIALFNPDDAKVGKPAICKIDSIKFQFSELSG